MIANLKIPKIELTAQQMKELGDREIKLVKADASLGISQEYTGSDLGKYKGVFGTSYSSYTDYKRNYMNRFTTRNFGAKNKWIAKGDAGGWMKRRNAAYVGVQGTKIKAYTGQSVISNEVGFVNLTLTGRMFSGMRVQNAKVNEVEVSFANIDREKVIGAEDLGRHIVGLNRENREIIEDMIAKILFKEVDTWAREDINIIINL